MIWSKRAQTSNFFDRLTHSLDFFHIKYLCRQTRCRCSRSTRPKKLKTNLFVKNVNMTLEMLLLGSLLSLKTDCSIARQFNQIVEAQTLSDGNLLHFISLWKDPFRLFFQNFGGVISMKWTTAYSKAIFGAEWLEILLNLFLVNTMLAFEWFMRGTPKTQSPTRVRILGVSQRFSGVTSDQTSDCKLSYPNCENKRYGHTMLRLCFRISNVRKNIPPYKR